MILHIIPGVDVVHDDLLGPRGLLKFILYHKLIVIYSSKHF